MSAPLVTVVGFLGAGKTTFLRELLPLLESRGLQPFVIINDYANARVDASSLKSEGRSVMPINGNCICCDSVIELIGALLEITLEPGRVVLIEANGTTDPTALIEHLLVNPELRKRFSPILQVAVVDAVRWQKRHWHNALERLQVETASHVLFTREDCVSKDRFAEVRSDIEWITPKAEWIKRQTFALTLEKLAKEASNHIEPNHSPASHAQSPEHDPPLGHSHHNSDAHENTHAPHHDHAHALDHHSDRHHLSHGFVGIQIDLPDPMPALALQEWMQKMPSEVLRVKGVVRLAEEPECWFQFQRMDDFRDDTKLFKLSGKPSVPACAVLIGVRLDEASLRRSLSTTLLAHGSLESQPTL